MADIYLYHHLLSIIHITTTVKVGAPCWYSQDIVDHSYLLRDLCIGWPENIEHARVLAVLSTYKVTSGELLLDNSLQVQKLTLQPAIPARGLSLPTSFMVDKAFPFIFVTEL